MTTLLRRANVLTLRVHSIPLHSDRNPFDEPGPPLPANDVLRKAQSFGIKVWKDESTYRHLFCVTNLTRVTDIVPV